jgi:aminoglycoside phosphotransferase (APT) family kinase protein
VPKLHADEVDSDEDLVRRLLAAQFPQWAHLPVAQFHHAGTDNAIYRIGDELSARLPRLAKGQGQIEKEREWLPRLAPHLPVTVPVQLERGEPGEGYPLHWGVYPWLRGRNASLETVASGASFATELAAFMRALQAIDATGAPTPNGKNFGRGAPLATRDDGTRTAIEQAADMIDAPACSFAWDEAVRAPAHAGPPPLIHGDLGFGNMLATGGRLSAVIDWGGFGAGDPACDLMVAWTLLDAPSRARLRAEVDVDDAAWTRGRGWALSVSLIQLPYYRDTNPGIIRTGLRTIAEVLADDA